VGIFRLQKTAWKGLQDVDKRELMVIPDFTHSIFPSPKTNHYSIKQSCFEIRKNTYFPLFLKNSF